MKYKKITFKIEIQDSEDNADCPFEPLVGPVLNRKELEVWVPNEIWQNDDIPSVDLMKFFKHEMLVVIDKLR